MTDEELTEYAADTPAKYAAQDENGEWWLYEIKPYILEVNRSWDSDGWQSWATMGKIPAGHDWRATLREVKPMTTTPNAPTWPRHPAHKADELTRQQMIDRCNATLAFWPTDAEAANQIMPVDYPWRWQKDDDGEATLMNLRSLSYVAESDWFAGIDLSAPQCLHYGGECGEIGYCAPCPNRPQPEYDPDDVAFKQPRYQDANGEDWIDEFARTATMDEFRGAMRFTVGKYNRRIGKKDDELSEVRKMRDYCERWQQYLLARR